MPFDDFHKVEPKFKDAWGQAQIIFDRDPIPSFIARLQVLLICSSPIEPPKGNPPAAFGQSDIAAPGSSDQVVAVNDDCMKHITESIASPYPHEDILTREAADLVAACDFCMKNASTPHIVAQHREQVFRILQELTAATKAHRIALRSLMPPTVAKLHKTVNIDIPVLYAVSKAVGSLDDYLPHCFVSGFPMQGYLHRTGWYRHKPREQTNFETEFHEWNVYLIRSIRKRGMSSIDPQGDKDCYDATLKECKQGFLDGPFTYDEVRQQLEGEEVVALRRFAQYRFPGAPARPCDVMGLKMRPMIDTRHQTLS